MLSLVTMRKTRMRIGRGKFWYNTNVDVADDYESTTVDGVEQAVQHRMTPKSNRLANTTPCTRDKQLESAHFTEHT
jgi:hypothetical protein